MPVLNTYKDFCCYKGMNSHHQKIFDRLASYYGEMLNKGPARINTIYVYIWGYIQVYRRRILMTSDRNCKIRQEKLIFRFIEAKDC